VLLESPHAAESARTAMNRGQKFGCIS
jgi:hypothetical protein